jgi:hypothetical protein
MRLVLALALALGAGCATGTVISRTRTGILIRSPKDVHIDSLVYEAADGTRVILGNYTSTANVGAIQAENDRLKSVSEGLAAGLAKGARP